MLIKVYFDKLKEKRIKEKLLKVVYMLYIIMLIFLCLMIKFRINDDEIVFFLLRVIIINILYIKW